MAEERKWENPPVQIRRRTVPAPGLRSVLLHSSYGYALLVLGERPKNSDLVGEESWLYAS